MVDKEFIKYFTKWKSKGYSEEQIRNYLIKTGYPSIIVDNAATESRNTTPPIPTLNNSLPTTPNWTLILSAMTNREDLPFFILQDLKSY